MSLSQLTTLIAETEERLTQMKAIATQLQEQAAKKAKKAAKKEAKMEPSRESPLPDFVPEFTDDMMSESDAPRAPVPVSKKNKKTAPPPLPKSPAAAPAPEPAPEPAAERVVSAWAVAMREVYTPLVKEALNGEKMPNGLHMKVAGYLKKNGNEKPTLDDVKAAIEFLQNNPDYKSDTAMRKTSDSGSETSSKKRGRPKKVAPVTTDSDNE
jgi:hypothetical protein